MKVAKFAFAVAIGVLYAAWAWGVWSAWQAMPWWTFAIALLFYLPAATLVLFLTAMTLIRADKQAHALPELAAFVRDLLTPLALIHNAANNLYPMVLLFGFDPAMELATTARLNRYVDTDGRNAWARLTYFGGWRRHLALAIRAQLLNFADYRGVHS